MTKTRIAIFAVLALAVIMPFSAKAIMFKSDDATYIAKDEVVSSSLFAAGSSVTIDGKVQGDVICAGQSITINGTVDGDVICAGQSITINGAVGGSVRVAGNNIVIGGKVSRNLMVAGANLNINPEAQIGWDATFAVATADIRGKVNRDIDGTGASATLAGVVGRNVYLSLDDNRQNKDNNKANLNVLKGATINGALTYRAQNEAKIEDASIKGEVKKLDYKSYKETKEQRKGNDGAWWKLTSLFSSILIGLILVSWLKKPIKEMTDNLLTKPWLGIGWGLLLLIVTPIAALILLFTMIGIPLSIILVGAWLLALYVGKIIVAIAFGRFASKKLWPNKAEAQVIIWPMIIGLVVFYLLFMIPVVGGLLCFVATLWGMGAIWQYAKLKS